MPEAASQTEEILQVFAYFWRGVDGMVVMDWRPGLQVTDLLEHLCRGCCWSPEELVVRLHGGVVRLESNAVLQWGVLYWIEERGSR